MSTTESILLIADVYVLTNHKSPNYLKCETLFSKKSEFTAKLEGVKVILITIDLC